MMVTIAIAISMNQCTVGGLCKPLCLEYGKLAFRTSGGHAVAPIINNYLDQTTPRDSQFSLLDHSHSCH